MLESRKDIVLWIEEKYAIRITYCSVIVKDTTNLFNFLKGMYNLKILSNPVRAHIYTFIFSSVIEYIIWSVYV
jgi:hypothetical protein